MPTRTTPRRALVLAFAMLVAGGCADRSGPANGPGLPENREPCLAHSDLRNVFYGDLHVHTSFSFDANAFDVRTTLDQAYGFARGEPVAVPPLDPSGQGTQIVRLERPLDFAAITDHSEFLGEVESCTTPGSPGYDSATCQQFRGGGNPAVTLFGGKLSAASPQRFTDVCGTDNRACLDVAGQVWQRIQDAAEAAYDRSSSCAFTSFVAYEYTANPKTSNMHRNVIFRNEHVPFPTTYFEQPTPQGLWRELKASCLDRGNGCDVLAIPHNPNESNGNMFHVEYPGAVTVDDQRAQAEFRVAMEPLVEIYQHKGDSECMNGLSAPTGAPDEQCDFEKRHHPPFEDCGDGTGLGGVATGGCVSRLDFVRNVLLAGMQEQERIGVNPYRLGIIASTDTHNGTPGATDEETWVGHRGEDDDTPAKRLSRGLLYPGGILFSPGGLVAVWAEENSRSSIFDALRRREVFGTSGTRIAVRFFGGWNYPATLCSDPAMIQKGYSGGTPMGGSLGPRPAGAGAPSFVVSALRDPGSAARPGTLLQRLQVIKGWIDGGTPHHQVFDVAGDAENGATADETSCEPSGPGADSLCAVWTDPSFDAAQHAFYYVRVLENPTCRWSTRQCNALAPQDRPDTCSDPQVQKLIQERAWSSPIWYGPSA